jgi:hypothetical protein
MIWPFRGIAKRWFNVVPRTKVIVEVPDALDPAIADRMYVDPLRRLLVDREAGVVVEVSQGAANTADEFTRIITIELTDLDPGLEIIAEFLVKSGAPAGTLTHVYDADGRVVDHFMLMP